MRKNIKKIIVSLALVSAFLVNGVQSRAETKTWKVYHNQGAPSNEGVFKCKQNMPAGGNVVVVNMTSYTNLGKTTIKTYRSLYPNDCKFLSASKKQQVLYVDPKMAENIEVSMSTTSAESTLAEGNFIR